jgi:phosphoenolpyruvate-protein kinase (PTS system EI component)
MKINRMIKTHILFDISRRDVFLEGKKVAAYEPTKPKLKNNKEKGKAKLTPEQEEFSKLSQSLEKKFKNASPEEKKDISEQMKVMKDNYQKLKNGEMTKATFKKHVEDHKEYSGAYKKANDQLVKDIQNVEKSFNNEVKKLTADLTKIKDNYEKMVRTGASIFIKNTTNYYIPKEHNPPFATTNPDKGESKRLIKQ